MIKTLTKHGNSWALVIDKPIMELLKIEPTTPLKVTTNGQTLVVGPADLEYEAKVRAASERINKRYSKVFKKLAE
jgi:antitoxin MazE